MPPSVGIARTSSVVAHRGSALTHFSIATRTSSGARETVTSQRAGEVTGWANAGVDSMRTKSLALIGETGRLRWGPHFDRTAGAGRTRWYPQPAFSSRHSFDPR